MSFFASGLLPGLATGFALHAPLRHGAASHSFVRPPCTAVRMASPAELDEDSCYLFDTEEGRKYVCTSNPEELAWHMGIDMKDMMTGAKPEDLNLVECAEEWSHTGTPQWVCREESPPQANGRAASAAAGDDEGCEIIGETRDEVWFACADDADKGDVECSEEDFGVGGGPGILPQEGQVLCKQEKPKAKEKGGPRFKL